MRRSRMPRRPTPRSAPQAGPADASRRQPVALAAPGGRRVALAMAVGFAAWATPAPAAPPAPAAAALAMVASGRTVLARGWSYQERVSAPQGTERLAYDASRPAGSRWRILSINGRAPSARQRQHLAKRAAAAARDAAGPAFASGGWLAHSDYRLVAHQHGRLVYLVEPRPGTGAFRGVLKHLSGRFVVASADHRPLELTLSNYESFSPRFGVTVHSVSFRAQFERIGRDGPVVVTKAVSEVKGKMFWLKGFADRTEVELSHFAPVAASAPAPATH